MNQAELASTVVARQLAECGNLFHRWQWSLSTSSNYSALLSDSVVAISRSGVDKQFMTANDFLAVDLHGAPLADFKQIRPSAETELHCHIYRLSQGSAAQISSVLHTHSKFAVFFSRRHAVEGVVRFSGFEMQKIFDGIDTHESSIEVPIFANSQKMSDITAKFDAYLAKNAWPAAYLIEGHGVYAWGKSVYHAKQKLEALEHLFEQKYMEGK